LSRKSFYLACFAVHFFLIVAISSRELFWVLSRSSTIFSAALNRDWQQAEGVVSTALFQNAAVPRPLRQGVTTYLHLAGIEAGYGFFAPNVSGSCKLVFELHYPDGRTESRVPAVSSHASGLRVATLLDKIGRPQYDPLRETMIKMLTQSIWREHSEAQEIQAVFGLVTLPTIDEFEHGIRESNEFLYAYDFAFRELKSGKQDP
jgi:hypothetical protein